MKVLLVRTDSQLGDTVFETCFYRELKRHFPASYITVMACGNRRVLENLPYIDEFIWLAPSGFKRVWQAFLALPYIWRQNYDVLVSLTPTLRMKIFNKLLRAKRKFPFEYRLGEPAVNAYVHVLKQLGVAEVDTAYTVVVPPQAQQIADTFLSNHALTHTPYLLVNPLASCKSYTLSVERVIQIITQLRQREMTAPVIVLNYQNKYDGVQLPNVHCFSSDDVLAVAAVVKKAAYVLTVDTSISHVAHAFSRPMTVLFTDQPKTGLPRAKELEHLISFAPPSKDVQVLWAKDAVCAIKPEGIVAAVLKGWRENEKMKN